MRSARSWRPTDWTARCSLGLVPATVERDVQGSSRNAPGAPERWVGQADVEAKSMRADGLCALPSAVRSDVCFDALIGNEGRTSDRLLYDASSWMLLLTGHDRAFGASKALPPHPQAQAAESRSRDAPSPCHAGCDIARAAWGNLLPNRDRVALLARRDALLGKTSAKPRVEEDSGPERREPPDPEAARGFHPVHVARDDHDG